MNSPASLPRKTPEAQGIASSALLHFIDTLSRTTRDLHSLMLLRHGCVVAEGWWQPYAPERPHLLFSVSKSVTALVVGLALEDGLFTLDDPVAAFFPHSASAPLPELRVRHLLTMTTGHTEDTWTAMEQQTDGDWIAAFFAQPLRSAPGTQFVYNTGASYMLSAIVQAAAGETLLAYAQRRLFAPLGIAQAAWQASPQGVTLGGIGLSLTTEALACIGQLCLQGGVWNGQPLVPPDWIAAATGWQIANGDADMASDWTQGYGYQFWRCRHGAYRADGVFGQYCVVMPEQDAVLVMTGGMDVFDMQQPLDAVWERLLPALAGAPLPDDPAAHALLRDRLAGLALPAAAGVWASPLMAQLSGRVWALDDNALGMTGLRLDFDGAGVRVTVTTAAGSQTFGCGFGGWRDGQLSVFNAPWLSGLQPVAASAAWAADDSLTMIVHLVETPFYYTLVWHFADAELLIDTRVSVALDAPPAHLLSGRLAVH